MKRFGVARFDVADSDLPPTHVEWSEAGRAEVVSPPEGACVVFSATLENWRAFVDGRLVAPASVDLMLTPRRRVPDTDLDYGLGVWLHPDGVLEIHGYDAGVSFRSLHHRATGVTATALANTSDGVGIVDALLDDWVRSGSSSTDARSGDI